MWSLRLDVWLRVERDHECVLCGVYRLQCCGLKLGEAPTAVPKWPELCGDGEGDRGSEAWFTPPDSRSNSPRGDDMLTHKRATSIDTHIAENGLTGCSGKLSKTPMAVRSKASIRDKISQWEGKGSEPTVGSCPATPGQREADSVRKKDIKSTEIQRRDSRRLVSRQDSGKENGGKTSDSRPMSPEGFVRDREAILDKGLRGKMAETVQDKKSVSTHIKKLEKAMKETPGKPPIAFPGNYFCPPSKEEQEETERKGTEPIFGTLDVVRSTRSRRGRDGDPENVYTEPGAPSINPVPKPQRTFQHHTLTGTPVAAGGLLKSRRNLPPLPSIPPPPLPTCPPPGVCRRPWAERTRDSSNRYSLFYSRSIECCPTVKRLTNEKCSLFQDGLSLSRMCYIPYHMW